MKATGSRQLLQDMFACADVRLDGSRPWDLRVHDEGFFDRVLAGGSLALGESYMDNWWTCDALDHLFDRIMGARLDKKVKKNKHFVAAALKAKMTNAQSRKKAYIIGRRHYDIGNRLFTLMLDKRMNYSCAFWDRAETLDDAQAKKLDLICRKLHLKPGMKLLDIGCGWGGLARWAAEKYQVRVTGITVSREQLDFARRYCRGLEVRFELKDYRELQETFDRIVSVGMFEHVGARNYRTYMKTVHRCLADNGLFLLHTIAGNSSTGSTDPWISRYIFPNSMLPSARQIFKATEKRLIIEDWHSFGPHYDLTLMAWHRNFTDNWMKIKDIYDGRFYRMWTYYLLSCAGSFRARRNQLWQIVFSKKGIRGGYRYDGQDKYHIAV